MNMVESHMLRWVCICMLCTVQLVWCNHFVPEEPGLPSSVVPSLLSLTGNVESLLDADSLTGHQHEAEHTDRPIIGILAQELTGDITILQQVAKALYSANLGSRSSLYMGNYRPGPDQVLDEQKVTREGKPIQEYSSHHFQDISSNQIDPEGFGISDINESSNQHNSSVVDMLQQQPLVNRVLAGNATYIAASYVKFVEAAGARVVPILINQEKEYYEKILKSINGVLFPGGAVAIDNTTGFGRAGKTIYDLSLAMNAAGDHFPLWGTCLGFELLTSLAAGGKEIRTHCEAQNTADKLKMDKHFRKGHLFRHISKHLLKSLTSLPITANFHHFCVTPKNLSSSGGSKVFRPLAYSSDANGLRYVAAVEARHAPFFATQFHPEKSPWEWTTAEGHNAIPHQEVAVEVALYMAQILGHHARKNNHRYRNLTDENSSLIYNYIPIYTGAKGSSLVQIYLF